MRFRPLWIAGVSHLLVDNDMDAIHEICKWVSFVPAKIGAPLPCLPVVDPIEREVGFYPPSGTPFDPRHLLAGDGKGLTGMLDEGSFVETLAGWAKTVVTGRGRLGGMPVGIIVTENRTVERSILADPANLESKPTKAKPFCAQVGCVNGNEAQRRRVLQLRDDLGWSSLYAEYEAEKRWVPIFLH